MILIVFSFLFVCLSTSLALVFCLSLGSLSVPVAWMSFGLGFLFSVVILPPEASLAFGGRSEVLRHKVLRMTEWTAFDYLILFAFTLFSLRHFLWIYFVRDQRIWTLNHYNYGDLPLHLAYIASFVRGAEFWPTNPIFAAEKIHYPFGFDLFTSLFVQIGVPLEQILPILGLLTAVLTFVCLFLWGRGFAVAAFLFSGSLVIFEPQDFAWKNLALALWIPQRGFHYALPAGLLLLWSWRRRFLTREEPLPSLVEGILWGLMPFFHFHTFVFLSFVFVVWSIAGRKIKEAFPIFLTAFFPAAFETLLLTDRFRLASFISWKPGWVAADQNILFFLAVNFGFWLFVVLMTACLLLWAETGDRLRKAKANLSPVSLCFFPGLLLFISLFFVMFSPWDWDNTKFMLWAYLLMLPAMDEFVLKPLRPTVRLLIYTALFFPGLVVAFQSLGKNQGVDIISVKEQDEVCAVVWKLPKEAVFATAQTFHHPVALCGGKLAAGYGGHLWSHGIRSEKIEERLTQFMKGEGDWRQKAREVRADYLFWGRFEKEAYPDSPRPWESQAEKVADGDWGEIYKL